MIIKELTGHTHYGSSYETSTDCGNCDGGSCDYCNAVWYYNDKPYDSKEEAREAELKEKKIVVYNSIEYDDISGFTIIDGILYAQIYIYNCNDQSEKSGYKLVPCDEEATFYADKFVETRENMKKFNECICINKNNKYFANSCDIFKSCNDCECYKEMKCGKRTERL